jgi:hypothetical protein
MAGGQNTTKFDPKQAKSFKWNNNEVLKDSQTASAPKKIGLISGILGLNQTVEINHPETAPPKPVWNPEFLVTNQEKQLFSTHEHNLKETIDSLRLEIKKLVATTENLDVDIQNIPLESTSDVSEYQINFLERIKNFIINFRKNISEASNWLDSFNTKKKKKNYFWSVARNKKQGGEQYLMSGEHGASRSVN